MQIERDRFGNTFYTFTTQPELVTLHYLIAKAAPKSALIFRGLNETTVTAYNREAKLENQMKYQGIYNKNDLQYFIRNGSNGPEIKNNKTWAAGMSIVVKYQNSYYYLLVKDKTKNILTNIGGFCNEQEFYTTHQFLTAIREVNEETTDYNNDKQQLLIPGLVIDPDNIKLFSVINFKSAYFGLTNMTDTYYNYRIYIDLDKTSQTTAFFHRLFDVSNKDTNNNYVLSYQCNDETQYICAIKMFIMQCYTSDELMKIATGDKNKLTTPISSLHAFLNYLHLNNILNVKQLAFALSNDTLIGFPPTVISLQTF